MFIRKLVLFFLFLTFCLKAFPAVFTVTSNTDSGPGTLRDALTQAAANGSAATDYIYFNLPDQSVAGRTITLNSLLPDLSPNLVIDGTTQPGVPFGVSNAKVRVFSNFKPTNLQDPYVFNGDQLGNLTISGLYLDALAYDGQPNVFAITINDSNVVTIKDCVMPEGNLTVSNNNSFLLQSSMIGCLPDGVTGFPSTVTVNNTLNVTIGGNPSEGNLLSGGLNLNMSDYNANWTYLISNNKMGTDYTGTSSSTRFYSQGRIDIESGHYNPPSSGRMQGTITNNFIENFSSSGIVVSGFGNVAIKGNSIGTDPTGKINFLQFAPSWVQGLGSAPTGIVLQVGIDAVVGGSNPGDKNTIGYISNGILEQLADQVVISQNSMFCFNRQYFNDHDFVTQAYTKPLPLVQINQITNNSISGTATPGARVELFSNAEGECSACDPRDYFTYVTADAQGKWSYTGTIPANIVASAIYNNQTSLFTKAKVIITNLKITQPQCGQSNGSIQGISFYDSGQIRWVDQNNNVISNSLDINNLPPGKYKFKIGTDVCGAESDWIELIDNSLKLDASKVKILNPSCNQNGSISDIAISTYHNESYNSAWMDENSKVIGNSIDISNLRAGKYTLTVTGNSTGCSQTYGPITLTNVAGPNIDQSHANITSTNCGESTGSITNIQVTGSGILKYSWLNDQQQQVATTLDLVNQPGGTYTLQVTDNSQCGPVFSTAIQIPETNGISLDESKVQTTIAGCGLNNGTVTGMQVTGTAQYKWADVNNNVVATTLDLKNAAPGDYTFTAYNNSGCSKTSKTYHVGLQAITQYPSYTVNIVPACSGQNNGSISISTDALVASMRWISSQGQNIGSTSLLNNVSKGTYQLFLTDANGCETLYNTYTVTELAPLSVTSQGQITSDQCGLKTGSVNDVSIAGGQAPYTYTWTDDKGNQVGIGSSIGNLAAGDYHLNVADSRCGSLAVDYTITAQSAYVAAPSVSDVQLCSSGDAFISVNNPSSTFTYRLYDDQNSAQPLDEENSGRFKVTVNANRSYFISQLNGTCESSRSEVKVTVGVSSVNIPNAFTPNGDGINDYWSLKGMENNPNSLVQVFTRYGQKVFESKGYEHPFDGTYGGKELPTGVYYYIINLGTNCNILSGNVTLIR
ncbi:MAG: gliding motility-associated C-terminal domain-containing protein [Bacteroidetes bacterium]|jgi:gliding motility-associated-like protein|nr:gliding motility-associated C-terminal domain-containing protein [Bacteroidota bacterium]